MDDRMNRTAGMLVGGADRAGVDAAIHELERMFPGKYDRLFVVRDPDYGDFYAVSVRKENDLPDSAGAFAEAESPRTIAAIKAKYPGVITVLIRGGHAPESGGEAAPCKCDFVRTDVDTTLFDIIAEHCGKDSGALARTIDYQSDVILEMSDVFPLPTRIDKTNETGYDQIADEYKEEYRITSCNFHTCSLGFFKSAIAKYIRKADRVLEIGPGQNWFVETFELPGIDYHSVDVSQNMQHYNRSKGKRKVVGSVRHTPFEDDYFDVIVGSLSDPYFFPSALMEIARILKKGGKFIFTTPSSKWSGHLREAHMNKTQFVRKDGLISEVYSFTMTPDEIGKLLSRFGMEALESEELRFVSRHDEPVSPALTISAENQHIPLDELVVLNGGVYRK